jgi:hypothetical protein
MLKRKPIIRIVIPHLNRHGWRIDAKYIVLPLNSWLASAGFRPTEKAIMRVPTTFKIRPNFSVSHSIIFTHNSRNHLRI